MKNIFLNKKQQTKANLLIGCIGVIAFTVITLWIWSIDLTLFMSFLGSQFGTLYENVLLALITFGVLGFLFAFLIMTVANMEQKN